MSTHAKTIIAGFTRNISFFLTLWAANGNEWSTQVLGFLPPTWRPGVTMGLAGLTAISGIFKTVLDAKGNARAKAANSALEGNEA